MSVLDAEGAAFGVAGDGWTDIVEAIDADDAARLALSRMENLDTHTIGKSRRSRCHEPRWRPHQYRVPG